MGEIQRAIGQSLSPLQTETKFVYRTWPTSYSPWMNLLRSTRFAFVVMAFFVAGLLVAGHLYFGWLGVGMVGLLGLVISHRAEIFADHSDPHERNTHLVVAMHRRKLDAQKDERAEEALKRKHSERRRIIMHRVINTVFAAILMLGGSMYFLHQM